MEVEAISVASNYPQSLRSQEFSALSRSAQNDRKVDKGPKVSFMTTLDRELFPTKMPQNRFGNEICPLRGAPHRGPGCYENEEKTNFWYEIEHKINSTKGYTLGARTGPRFPKEDISSLSKATTQLDILGSGDSINLIQRQNTAVTFKTPSPTAYQTKSTELHEFDRSKKPFLVGADRFPVYRRDIQEVLPGQEGYTDKVPVREILNDLVKYRNVSFCSLPYMKHRDKAAQRKDVLSKSPGVYEHDIKRNRKVQWPQSFGSTPVYMPTIQVRSIIDQNTEKLYSTKQEKKYNRKLAYMKLYYA